MEGKAVRKRRILRCLRGKNNRSTKQSTSHCLARLRHALDEPAGHIHLKLPTGKVVQEEERSCAVTQDVVDAHGDQVLTHRSLVTTATLSNLE